jgi:hypothetical protein
MLNTNIAFKEQAKQYNAVVCQLLKQAVTQ